MSRLAQIRPLGQRIWLDNLSRSLLADTLQKLVQEDGIAGVTSNPAIFQKAFATDPAYQADLQTLKQQPMTAEARYEALALTDIRRACQLLLPMWKDAAGRDGLVSLEVSPALAHDCDGTIAAARRLWQAIDHPNAMIKIPATPAGLQAFSKLIAEGININLTLLFSLQQLDGVYVAYEEGVRNGLDQGVDLSRLQVVASFFLSRIDSLVDPMLTANGADSLQGKSAIALARTAYTQWQQRYQTTLKPLSEAGVPTLRLLWASTGTKNPAYSDVLYVDQLIGADTVNTVPDATLNAFRDHGTASASLDDGGASQSILTAIAAAGISLNAIGEQLQRDGLKLFDDAFAQLLAQTT